MILILRVHQPRMARRAELERQVGRRMDEILRRRERRLHVFDCVRITSRHGRHLLQWTTQTNRLGHGRDYTAQPLQHRLISMLSPNSSQRIGMFGLSSDRNTEAWAEAFGD